MLSIHAMRLRRGERVTVRIDNPPARIRAEMPIQRLAVDGEKWSKVQVVAKEGANRADDEVRSIVCDVDL